MEDRLRRDVLAKLVSAVKDFIENTGASLDVQINGESIVIDGVANIPIGTINNLGVVKPGSTLSTSASNTLNVKTASTSNIKAGTTDTTFIVPNVQHYSVFYGLAKAAGDSSQSSSSNAVGSYTDSALDKILQMIGVSALIGTVETDTAAHAYSSGDCFLFGGKLVKATENIAVDDTIAIGTNCTQTTLLAEIASA